jgi:SNF2 family DNA or RNA helicase
MSYTPYTLDYKAGRIHATGLFSVLTNLAALPGYRQENAEAVSFTVSREAFLIAEALAHPEATLLYTRARRKWLKPSREELQAVEARFRETGDGSVPSLLIHQWEFLALSLDRRAAYNGSEQGLGKTRMALALLRLWGCRRIVVVMPQSLATQWAEEMPAIWPEVWNHPHFVNVTSGASDERKRSIRCAGHRGDDTVILAVNYEMLETLLPDLVKFRPDCIIGDELWKIKNPRAKMTKALVKLSDRMQVAGTGHTMGLAGTPLGKDAGELWSQLRFLGKRFAPETHRQFLARYARLEPLQLPGRTLLKPVGVADPAGLMQRLTPVWFRATKATCLNLPPKVRQVIGLRLPPTIRDLYRRVEREGLAALGDEMSLAGQAVVNLRLQQITGGHRPTLPEGVGEEWAGWYADPLPDCPKIGWVRQWAEDTLAAHPQTRAIIWCRFNAEVERITRELSDLLGKGRVVGVTGATKPGALDAIKQSFNDRDPEGVQVIVAQIQRLFAGHNLQAADWMVYFSHSWFSIEHWQSEDRAHRMGRADAVNYVHLIANETIDEEVWSTLSRNEDFVTRFTPCTAARVLVDT